MDGEMNSSKIDIIGLRSLQDVCNQIYCYGFLLCLFYRQVCYDSHTEFSNC